MNIVYLTTNLINGKQYVGSHKTLNENDGYLGSGKILTKAISKYGKFNFKREIIKECNCITEAQLLEEKYINEYNTLLPNGYNLSPVGGCGIPRKSWGKHTQETKDKIKKSTKEAYKNPELREKISKSISGEKNGFYGKSHSEETIEKMRILKLGKIHSEETKEKMSKSRIGKKFSESHKEKMSISKKGNKNPMFGVLSPMKGKKHSEETRKKISETLKKRAQTKLI